MKIVPLLLLVMIPCAVAAQVGPAVEVSAEKKIVGGLSASIGAEYRWKDGFSYTDRIAGTLSLDYKLNKYLKFGAGYSILHKRVNYVKTWESDTATLNYWQNRHRFMVNATGSYKFGSFKVSLRERFQYTMWDKRKIRRLRDENGKVERDEYGYKINEQYSEGRFKPVLRSRLQVSYDRKKWKFSPYASIEFFNLLNPKTDYEETDGGNYDLVGGKYTKVDPGTGEYVKEREKSLDRISYTAGVDWAFKKHQELGLYYQYNDYRNGADTDDVKHRIGLSYTFSF